MPRAAGWSAVRVVCGWIVAAALSACAPEPRTLDVVVISLDTLRADALGAYGARRPTSPTFDRFAQQAVLFERAYSQAPMTDRKSTRLNSSHNPASRMPSSA
jgi:glucan phosphoethanolaminetransferase (alkaline phosphatase superfamily)